jgi:hypothetical protein
MSGKPIARLRYWDRAENREYDVASVWKSDFQWKQDVKSENRPTDNEKFPRMKLSEAAARAERGEGRLSYALPKEQKPIPKPNQDFTDDDIGF